MWIIVVAGLPWWQVIGATTVVLRIIVFPIVCIAQKNMVVINNHQVQEEVQISIRDSDIFSYVMPVMYHTRYHFNHFRLTNGIRTDLN